MPPRLAVLLCCLLAGALLVRPALGQKPSCAPLWGMALDGLPITTQALAKEADDTGLEAGMVVFFLQWPRPGQPGFFPLDSLQAIRESGAMPVLTWEPMYLAGKGREQVIPLKDILDGACDAYLDDFATQARQFGQRFIIRLAHEMNLERYHWGAAKDAYGPASPEIYRKLFCYVVRRFKGRGANNVLWAFCPNAESLPHPQWHGADWNQAANYYPGDDVVDVLGMDGYNWGLSKNKAEHGWDSRWQSFRQIFEPLRQELVALAPDKPLVVFETSCAIKGGDRENWVRDAIQAAREWRLAALGWFQADKEVDWRLIKNRDAKALEYLRAHTADPANCESWGN